MEPIHVGLTKDEITGNARPIPSSPHEKEGLIPPGFPHSWLFWWLSFWAERVPGLGDWIMKAILWLVRVDAPNGVSARYEPREGDVFVCSFAKCGFHWMGQTLLQIAWRGRIDFDHIHQLVPWIEFPAGGMLPANASLLANGDKPSAPIRSAEGIRVIKTHLKQCDVPMSPRAKYVVIVRDPCDAVASGYPFMLGNLRSVVRGSFTPQQWYESYVNNAYMPGSWAKHTAGYWKIRHMPNVLFLGYENDMKRDLPGTIDRISEFVGVALTAEEKALVVKRCGFEHMKKHANAFRSVAPMVRSGDKRHLSPVIRKGSVGSAGEFFTREQLRRIEQHSRNELRKLGCDLPYDEFFGAIK